MEEPILDLKKFEVLNYQDPKLRRYEKVYEDFRLDLIQKGLHGYDVFDIDILDPNIKAKRIT